MHITKRPKVPNLCLWLIDMLIFYLEGGGNRKPYFWTFCKNIAHCLGKPPSPLELSAHIFLRKLFLELQKSYFFSGQALTYPLPLLVAGPLKKYIFGGFPKRYGKLVLLSTVFLKILKLQIIYNLIIRNILKFYLVVWLLSWFKNSGMEPVVCSYTTPLYLYTSSMSGYTSVMLN